MKLLKPSKVNGRIEAPASKSVAQRAILCALFSEESKITINSLSDDIKAAINCFKAFGGVVSRDQFIGPKEEKKDYVELYVGESGFLARSLPYIAPFFSKEFKIIGNGSLKNREINPPFCFKGSGVYEIENVTSSQYISGLLIALSQCKEDSIVKLKNIPSFPYLELTVDVVNNYGGNIESLPDGFLIRGGRFKNIDYYVEGDWSGASNFLVLAALAGEVSISGLRLNSKQGDKEIINVLRDFGADLILDDNLVTVRKNQNRRFVYDATDTPDLVPALLVLASKCDGRSEIKGIHRLSGKESDRDRVLFESFRELGVIIEREKDSFFITGSKVRGGNARSFFDHRIAMALSILGIVSEEGVGVLDPLCVSKSYPDFFCSLASLGATILDQ